MDILDSPEDTNTQNVLIVKDEYADPIIGRNKGKSKSGKKSLNRSSQNTVQLVEEDQQIKYETEQDGVAVTYRVVELSPDLSGSPSTSPTIYNPINAGLCVLPHLEVYPVSPNQKALVPSVRVSDDFTRSSFISRDDRRRATHNEVERRRRDKINNWIMKLSKIIPECKNEPGKGSFESQSKGCILAKACDYITELKDINKRLALALKQHEQLSADMEAMTRKLKDISQENEILKATLAQHGLSLP